MYQMKVKVFLSLFISIWLITSCGTTALHDSGKLTREQAAYIVGLPGWNPLSIITVQVYSIDNKKVTRKTNKFEVAPGKHRLEVRCSREKPEFLQRHYVFNINMLAGHRYKPKLDMTKECYVMYEESGTGKQIVGVES